MILKKGETVIALDDSGSRTLQITEITPVGDAYIIVQFYIEGSRKQVDVTNPNPPDKPTGTSEPTVTTPVATTPVETTPAPATSVGTVAKVEDLNR